MLFTFADSRSSLFTRSERRFDSVILVPVCRYQRRMIVAIAQLAKPVQKKLGTGAEVMPYLRS